MTENAKTQLSFDFDPPLEVLVLQTPKPASAVVLDLRQVRARKQQISEKDEERLLMQAIRQSVAHLM